MSKPSLRITDSCHHGAAICTIRQPATEVDSIALSIEQLQNAGSVGLACSKYRGDRVVLQQDACQSLQVPLQPVHAKIRTWCSNLQPCSAQISFSSEGSRTWGQQHPLSHRTVPAVHGRCIAHHTRLTGAHSTHPVQTAVPTLSRGWRIRGHARHEQELQDVLSNHQHMHHLPAGGKKLVCACKGACSYWPHAPQTETPRHHSGAIAAHPSPVCR